METYHSPVLKSNTGLTFERNLDDSTTLRSIDTWCTENDGSGSEEYDTDLEESFKEDYSEYHKTSEEIYQQTCRQLATPPVSRFLRQLNTDTVDLQHYGIGDRGILAVAEALERNITVRKLNLHDNSLTHVGAKALAEMLKDNCFISQLDVSENRFGPKGIESFGDMLVENASLWNLRLENCDLHEGDLYKLLKADRILLRVLNLKGNELGDEDAITVGSFLEWNESLEELDLSWNAIHLQGAAALAKGLKTNRALRSVSLSRNSISNKGALEIGKALKVNRKLQILDVTNCGFNEIGAENILEGLRNNTVLEVLRIGRNTIHDYGAYKILKSIRKFSLSALKQLDLEDSTLDQACIQELDKLMKDRPGFICRCGTVIKGRGITKKQLPFVRRSASETPIVVQKFLSFVNTRGWRLIDLFRIITRGNLSGKKVDHDRFAQSLTSLGVPLKKVQLQELFGILDVDGDGFVGFQDFLAMKQQTKEPRK
ncbi:leucine-rich repeat-containing protein 74A-like [Montipora foliosa]|uniref:leucine-rich repeat-containing protein 74A-like n=1 Tax=Montipora foliosa TaxID=591990 RepID=UPI0035F1E1D7